MSTSSDDEIAADANHADNKVPCVVEETLERCQRTGFDASGMVTFEGQLKGELVTIIFA